MLYDHGALSIGTVMSKDQDTIQDKNKQDTILYVHGGTPLVANSLWCLSSKTIGLTFMVAPSSTLLNQQAYVRVTYAYTYRERTRSSNKYRVSLQDTYSNSNKKETPE